MSKKLVVTIIILALCALIYFLGYKNMAFKVANNHYDKNEYNLEIDEFTVIL